MIPARPPRLAVRGILIHDNRLLLVNAWADPVHTLWCAPGGGVEPGASLPDNLRREIHEETGLTVDVGPPCIINEFNDPPKGFHQVEVFFRCTLTGGDPHAEWTDPEGIVTRRGWFTRDQLQGMHLKPDSLPEVAFGDVGAFYDPLEPIAY